MSASLGLDRLKKQHHSGAGQKPCIKTFAAQGAAWVSCRGGVSVVAERAAQVSVGAALL